MYAYSTNDYHNEYIKQQAKLTYYWLDWLSIYMYIIIQMNNTLSDYEKKDQS